MISKERENGYHEKWVTCTMLTNIGIVYSIYFTDNCKQIYWPV